MLLSPETDRVWVSVEWVLILVRENGQAGDELEVANQHVCLVSDGAFAVAGTADGGAAP